ncbi:MAG: efflux RND transporter permease subunit [Planctomycetota bacterium]|nr:efflux RND transporter permease subunit [Planctomycetota bacterium]
MSDSPQSETPQTRGILAMVPKRPVAVTCIFLAVALFGMVSLDRLPMDLLPEISYPTLTVRTTYPGAAPEDVEDRISERVSESLSTLNGLVRSSSISRAETSDVLLEFTWGTNMTFAVQEVRDRLDSVFLPNNAERPLILRYDPNLDPILRVGIRAPIKDGEAESTALVEDNPEALIRLRWLAEQRIKRQLESIKGLAAVQVHGGLEEEILIQVDPDRLAAMAITPSLIGTRLAQENLNASAGQIREGSTDYLVRTLNEFKSVDEIANLALERRDNATIRIKDVATIERTYAEREVVTRIGGSEAVEITVFREAGANIVDVARQVRQIVFGTEEQQRLAQRAAKDAQALNWGDKRKLTQLAYTQRKDASFELLSDQSVFIEAAVSDVRQAGMLGAIFAVIVMWLFLRRVTATLIIAVAIPISVIGTFAPMLLSGVSLNIMSLGGLALGIGMLVDNAIVVLESITRCRDEGDDLVQASIRGVREVAGAITASTLTTVAIFAPIVFVEGIAGQIFTDQAVTVVSSLLVSLAVALLFIPMLASRQLLASPQAFHGGYAWIGASWRCFREEPSRVMIRFGKFFDRFCEEQLLHGLDWGLMQIPSSLALLAFRVTLFVIIRIALLFLVLPIFVLWILGFIRRFTFDVLWSRLEWIYPRVLGASLKLPIVVLAGVGLLGWGAWDRSHDLALELLPEIHQGEFTAFMALGVGTPIDISETIYRGMENDVRRVEGVAGTALMVGVESDTLTREIEGENTARLTVRLEPEYRSKEREGIVQERVRRIIESEPSLAKPPTFRRPTPFTLEAPISIEVRGHDLAVLAEVAGEVQNILTEMPGLSDVRTTLQDGHPEALLIFDRDKALAFDLDIGAMSDFVRDQVLGRVDTRFVEGEERIEVRVRADQDRLGTLEDIRALIVNPESDNPIPLSAVASLSQVQGPAEIRRIGNTRAVLVTASTTSLDLGGTARTIDGLLNSLRVPDGVIVEMGGQKRELDSSRRSLTLALLLAIFLVYVVMATQFESLLQPFIILFSVPLAGIGVVYTLYSLSIPVSVVVFVGMILLAGIVVNNAIVLVDRINQKRTEGLQVHQAILEAGGARLRPIMMTTLTTILGLLPLTGWLAHLPGIGPLMAGFGAGEGAEMRAPMAVTVVTGLASSTVLTLLVVPVLYSLLMRRDLDPQPTEEVTQ